MTLLYMLLVQKTKGKEENTYWEGMREGSDTAIYAISTKNERKRRKYLPGGYARVREDVRGYERMREDAEGVRGHKRMRRVQEDTRGCERM